MNPKYYNDAIIGNKNIRATFSNKGELLRMYYPTIDFKQFIDFFKVGVKINDSSLIYLHEDINNRYNQYYIEDTNILNTEIENTYFNLKIEQTDFITIKENVMIKKYSFTNCNKIDLNIDFLIHSKLITAENNEISGKIIENGLLQYDHDNSFCIISNKEKNGHKISNSEECIKTGVIEDHNYEGLSHDSSISYKIGTLKPGEKTTFNIFITIYDNNEVKSTDKIEEKNRIVQKLDIKKEYEKTKKYWKKYLQEHNKIEISEIKDISLEKLEKIYKRTILLFPLLQNEKTGGISAAVEVDETMEKSGGYSYCWPRDAVFIAKAFDELGMNKETEKFYKTFCKITQSDSGMWQQRFYTDGKLAPCWGYQIDETASIIYGIYEHYKFTKDTKFITENIKMCENAMNFLFKYLDSTLCKEEKDIVKKEIEEKTKELRKTQDKIYKKQTRDIWETEDSVHLYSLAAIYASFNAMSQMYDLIKSKYEENRLKQDKILNNITRMKEYNEEIKKYISKNLYNEEIKILYRNTKDRKMDISMIGSVVPFEMFGAKEKKVINTIEKINLTLRTYTGGYIRNEEDSYMGGNNPWPIATLWMALYYIKVGKEKEAIECIKFVIESSTKLGFLSEQVDNNTMQAKWVIGLGWSHAMYILVIKELFKKNKK